MPKYEYECIECGAPTSFTQSIHDDLVAPVHCDKEMRQVFGSIAVQFKAKGFYSTDNR